MILTEKDLQLLNSLAASVPETDKKDNDLKIEFDGTTVLCRVCGDKASGFHYGVHSCEGCKGFFRRSIQQKIQYRPCTKNQQCSILRINRNRCQYCRLKKCIAVGMSRDAVRFGRVPKREKAKILAAMQKVNANSQEKALFAELEDEFHLLTIIVRAHEETCDYTKEKVAPLLEKARAHPVSTQCSREMACPLHLVERPVEDGASSRFMEKFSERFSTAINGVVSFAKRIPGFGNLSLNDQVTLLRAGVFEVLLVRLACLFDSQTNCLICVNGYVMRRESVQAASNARFMIDSMFDFADRLNGLNLTDSEVGLFCVVILMSPDRPGMRNTELVHKIQKKMLDILEKSVAANHPENPNIFSDLMKKIPDLRTLNTLHAEKLVAYQMIPQNRNANSASANNGANDAVPEGTQITPSVYPTIPYDIWSQYSFFTNPQCLSTMEEDIRSTSPGQHSQHGGSSSGSEWSTTDSKDDHDLVASPRSVSSGICNEDVKSPLHSSGFPNTRCYGNEDVWSSETPTQNVEFHNISKGTGDCNASEQGSSSGDEGYYIDSPIKGHAYPKLRRVDSPTDSGIESGKEHGPSTTPTMSVCSSPRSAMEEKVKDVMDQVHVEKSENIEDMPVLKRALQAPPLVNTNMLMDEAYRNHKKFRAARRDVESTSNPSISLASSHSTLVRTLEQAPRYLSEQQLKRTDFIHNIIMQTETLPGQQVTHHHQSQPSTSHQEASSQPSCGTSGMRMPMNGSCPYTSVPSSSVPPNFAATPQQKSMLVCPSGYYIPHSNLSNPIYSSTPSSWPFVGSQSSITTPSCTSVVTPSPMHVQTHFVPNASSEHSHAHNSPVSLPHNQQPAAFVCSTVAANSSHVSRNVQNCRSPVASSSPLVMNGGMPSTALQSTAEARLASPVNTMSRVGTPNDVCDSQPLNLSKKLFSPQMLKMES